MLQHLLDLIFPPQCGGCDAPGTGACERCLPRIPSESSALETLHVSSLGKYEGSLRHVVLALKKGRRDVARSLGERLCDLVVSGEILVPVPTTAARRRERGFDGCTEIARIAAARTGCRVLQGLIQVSGDRQRGRNRDARLAARGRFCWRGVPLHGIRVTLVDDVVTTGATLEDCARALRSAGAITQRAITIAAA